MTVCTEDIQSQLLCFLFIYSIVSPFPPLAHLQSDIYIQMNHSADVFTATTQHAEYICTFGSAYELCYPVTLLAS